MAARSTHDLASAPASGAVAVAWTTGVVDDPDGHSALGTDGVPDETRARPFAGACHDDIAHVDLLLRTLSTFGRVEVG